MGPFVGLSRTAVNPTLGEVPVFYPRGGTLVANNAPHDHRSVHSVDRGGPRHGRRVLVVCLVAYGLIFSNPARSRGLRPDFNSDIMRADIGTCLAALLRNLKAPQSHRRPRSAVVHRAMYSISAARGKPMGPEAHYVCTRYGLCRARCLYFSHIARCVGAK